MITVIHETSSAFNANVISTLYTRISRTSSAPFCIGQAQRKFLNRRRRLQIRASSLVLPFLPFPIEQMEPYLTGEVTPLQDVVVQEMRELSSKVLELRETLHSLNSLEIKLKTPEQASLQTRTMNSLTWAENEQSLDFATDFVPSAAERISFAALQLVSGATQSDLLKLQREKLKSMDVMDTVERLDLSLQLARYNIASVAAKLALQSLELR